jgi:uncharacterized protein YjdB
MPTYRLVYNKTSKVALVQLEATAVPGGSVNAGTFVYPDGTNTVLFHHIRDLLYKLGVQDMQSTRITLAAGAAQIPVEAIHVTPNAFSIAVNATQQLTVAYVPTNASTKTAVYESEDPTIATVNASGLVTGKKKGKTRVAIASTDGGKTDFCTVTVT